MNDIDFSYAAGKITNAIGGVYSATGSFYGTSPGIQVDFNADGSGLIQRLGDSTGGIIIQTPFSWYAGGIPNGPTQYTITATAELGYPQETFYCATTLRFYDPGMGGYQYGVIGEYTPDVAALTSSGQIDASGTYDNNVGVFIGAGLAMGWWPGYEVGRVNIDVTFTRGSISKMYNFDLEIVMTL